jgi:hypothetical protein
MFAEFCKEYRLIKEEKRKEMGCPCGMGCKIWSMGLAFSWFNADE